MSAVLTSAMTVSCSRRSPGYPATGTLAQGPVGTATRV